MAQKVMQYLSAGSRSPFSGGTRKRESIANVHAITQDEVKRLNDIGIVTIPNLWSEVGKNFDRGISIVAKEAGLAPERLLAILVAVHEFEARRNDQRLMRFCWKAPWFLY